MLFVQYLVFQPNILVKNPIFVRANRMFIKVVNKDTPKEFAYKLIKTKIYDNNKH